MHPVLEHWLDAHSDPLATLYTFSSCITLADFNGTGENKLIIADLGTGTLNMKLKVYKGTSLMMENAVVDLPTGVVSFHMDMCEPRLPAVAVASSSYIYIYKNMRPYFKFTLPTLDINPMEQDLWDQARDDSLELDSLYELLDGLRNEIGESKLTARSQRLLMLEQSEWQAFVDIHKGFPLRRQTVVTCIATLKKSHADEDAVSCLVLGTESCSIYILDPEAFTILANMSLPSVPVFLSVTGQFDVEYRIVIACRNGHLYTLKRGWKVAKLTVELDSHIVGLERKDRNTVVALMDETLQCFSHKGKKLYSLKLPATVTAMEGLELHQHGVKLIAVALSNNQVHFYQDKFLVDSFATEDTITAMKFGRFGREDNTLVLVTRGGGLLIKILKRTARFEVNEASQVAVASSSLKLNVPKKTKLFVDQTMRERENSVLMHRVFQHDLYRLRLNTARSYVNALENSYNPVSTNVAEPLKLSAQVVGLGPMFKIRIELQNTSSSQPSRSLAITFYCDDKLYSIHTPFIPVPMLVPGLQYCFETLVECISELGISDQVKVFVLKGDQVQPILTAVINMPVTEMSIGS